MSTRPHNRFTRPPHRLALALIAGAAGLAMAASPAMAQLDKDKREKDKKPAPQQQPASAPKQPVQPPPPPPDPHFAEKVLAKTKVKEWTIKPELHVSAGKVRKMVDKTIIEEARSFSFSSVAVVFPVLENSASHKLLLTPDGSPRVKGELFWNEKLFDSTPTFAEGYQSGVRLGRWELRNVEGKELDLKLEFAVACYETALDEKLAGTIPWPKNYFGVGASALKPQQYVEYGPAGPDPKDTAVADFVKDVLGGKDPRSMPPLRVAKMLAAAVQERLQPSGDGLTFNRNSSFRGFELRGAPETLRERRGSQHEIACVMAAVLKQAGLPARTVIGWDLSDTKGAGRGVGGRGGSASFRSWVEFCLIDPGTLTEIWIPVDPVRMRRAGSRAKPIDQPWKYFGTSDELADIIPLSFHYLPPTTVYADAPCLWGWLTMPESAPHEASLKFTAFRLAKRGDDPKPQDGPERR